MKRHTEPIIDTAKRLGFEVKSADFDSATVVLRRGEETFTFVGLDVLDEALRLAESAVVAYRVGSTP